jgi:uncharacterized membrane protein YphA (DoxX/SURF4 family)
MILKNPWFQRLLRIVIGCLFLYVGYARLRYPHMVAEHIMVLGIVPWGLVNFFAMWMLSFEAFAGILILSGVWLRACSIMLVAFCVVCTCLISYALLSGLQLHCGCFVTAATGSARSWASLWQEGLMFAGCFALWKTTDNQK